MAFALSYIDLSCVLCLCYIRSSLVFPFKSRKRSDHTALDLQCSPVKITSSKAMSPPAGSKWLEASALRENIIGSHGQLMGTIADNAAGGRKAHVSCDEVHGIRSQFLREKIDLWVLEM